ACYLGASYTGSVTRSGVHNYDWPFPGVGGIFRGGLDPNQRVISRVFESASINDYVIVENEDRRLAFLLMLYKNVASLAHHVPEKQRTLPRINPVRKRLGADIGRRPLPKKIL